MNKKQALAKARRLFGAEGAIERKRKPTMHTPKAGPLAGQLVMALDTHRVGRSLPWGFRIEGDGPNWDAAFAEYERKRASTPR